MRPYFSDKKLIIKTIVLSLLILYGIKWGGALAVYSFAFIGIILAILDRRNGFYFYLLLTLVSPDYVLQGLNTDALNLYTTTIAGQSVFTVYTLILVLIFVAQEKRWIPKTSVFKYEYYIVALFVVSLLANLTTVQLGYSVGDLSIILVPLFVLIIGYLSGLKSDQLITILVVVLIVKYVRTIILFALGIGMDFGNTIRVSADTIRVVPHLLILIGIARLLYKKRGLLSWLFILVGGIYTFIYSSRGAMLITVVVIILCFLFYSSRKKKFSRTIFYLALIPFMLFLSFKAVTYFNPSSGRFIAWKFSSILTMENKGGEASSAGVRYLEFLNITHYLRDDVKRIVLGTGPGGYFNDNYIPYSMGVLGKSAYPAEQISSGKIQKPHGLPLFILLKIGFVFGLLYYFFNYKIYKIAIKNYNYFDGEILLAIVSFFPTFFVRAFSSKLQILLGMFLLLIFLVERSRLEKKIHYKPKKRGI